MKPAVSIFFTLINVLTNNNDQLPKQCPTIPIANIKLKINIKSKTPT